ncbi:MULTISPECIES: hypothetical protein [Parafrankia]|nr:MULTISPECIES: hypothetical protein [Parafrankia]MBE3203245.1 hypothetical protein [Parafrankia sp. CH37]
MKNPSKSTNSDSRKIPFWDRFVGWLSEHGNPLGRKLVAQVMAALLGLAGAWIIAAKTIEPRIPLDAATVYIGRFYREISDPAKIHAAWQNMTTKTFQTYSSLPYRNFRKFWANQQRPSILDVSKDGSNTFAVSIQFHPKGKPKGTKDPEAHFAAVLQCDDRVAIWTFTNCDSRSLKLEDLKDYDLRVLDGG